MDAINQNRASIKISVLRQLVKHSFIFSRMPPAHEWLPLNGAWTSWFGCILCTSVNPGRAVFCLLCRVLDKESSGNSKSNCIQTTRKFVTKEILCFTLVFKLQTGGGQNEGVYSSNAQGISFLVFRLN